MGVGWEWGGGGHRSRVIVGQSSLLLGHEVVDGLAGLQALLHVHHQSDAIHHHLHQLHLREAQPVGVGDVEDSAHCGGVHAT